MHPISLDHSSLFPASPLTLIELAAENGCPMVSLRISAPRHWDLVSDAALRRDVRAHCERLNVRVLGISAIWVGADAPVLDFRPQLEASADVRANNVVFLSDEPDAARRQAVFLRVCEQADAFGLGVAIEHLPYSAIRTVQDAVALIEPARRERFGSRAGLLADVLHLYRSGGTVADYAVVKPQWFLHAQICDGLLAFDPDPARLLEEARFQRLAPGEGEFALADFLRALPDGLPVGIEVPLRAEAQQGVSFADRARRIVAATRRVMARAG